MLTFPVNETSNLYVIEPGNVQRLKEGRPLKVGEHLLCFTPDIEAFLRKLGIEMKMPDRGDINTQGVAITADQLQDALDECQNLPEVNR